MKIKDRHEEVKRMFAELEAFYEKFFPPAREMTDKEWQAYIDGTWEVADKYRGTSLEDLAGELTMALSNDIERVNKAWEKKNEVQTTKQE